MKKGDRIELLEDYFGSLIKDQGFVIQMDSPTLVTVKMDNGNVHGVYKSRLKKVGGSVISKVTDAQLKEIRDHVTTQSGIAKAWMIKAEIKIRHSITLDESTIRGRFIEMGEPLSGKVTTKAPNKPTEPIPNATKRENIDHVASPKQFPAGELAGRIPTADEFVGYINRGVDTRLAVHYNIGPMTGRYKYPISQGKQGTGKTFGHKYYAHKNQLPFFLFSCYDDFRLPKIFGDKTIQNGSIVFQESEFVKAIQAPCVVLFDEINAVSNANTFDFHALLQNRELWVKDANNSQGKLYKLHHECRIGFAQNPKSAKYIGGNIKPSNFLGRCTYITYPEFTKKEIKDALKAKFPALEKDDLENFTKYYFTINETISRSNIPVDVSIRQITNVIDLWIHGLDLKHALEDGLSSILEAISQPTAKDSFLRIAQAIWKELM